MNDILRDLNTALEEMSSGVRNTMMGDELAVMLYRASTEIARLRERNNVLSWQVNPEAMGR